MPTAKEVFRRQAELLVTQGAPKSFPRRLAAFLREDQIDRFDLPPSVTVFDRSEMDKHRPTLVIDKEGAVVVDQTPVSLTKPARNLLGLLSKYEDGSVYTTEELDEITKGAKGKASHSWRNALAELHKKLEYDPKNPTLIKWKRVEGGYTFSINADFASAARKKTPSEPKKPTKAAENLRLKPTGIIFRENRNVRRKRRKEPEISFGRLSRSGELGSPVVATNEDEDLGSLESGKEPFTISVDERYELAQALLAKDGNRRWVLRTNGAELDGVKTQIVSQVANHAFREARQADRQPVDPALARATLYEKLRQLPGHIDEFLAQNNKDTVRLIECILPLLEREGSFSFKMDKLLPNRQVIRRGQSSNALTALSPRG